MKRLWKRKWLVIPLALVIFLSVGAVAWAATSGGSSDQELCATEGAGKPFAFVSLGGNGEDIVRGDADLKEALKEAGATVREAMKDAGARLRKAIKAAREHWREERADKMESLRDEMTPGDRALYDDLVEKLQDQQEELREVREELKETLGELRELCEKYLTDED